MELIPVDYTQDYKAYKAELDTELNKAAEGFVKIGYLLKVARDTNVLKESGYTSVAEFAAAEYGLTKDVVSRYIAINDRFSENGYSPCLADQYSSFGSAKLQEMLTLPDSILEHISSDTTKAEIQLIKKEYAEEQSISDIEVAIEAEELIQRHQEQSQYPYRQNGTTPSNNMEQLIYDYFHGEPEEYSRLFNSSDIYEQLVPTGIKTIIGRVPGVGKLIMSIKDIDSDIVISNMRDPSFRETYSWEQLVTYISILCDGSDAKEQWKEIFGEAYPVTEKPVPEKTPTPEPSKASTTSSKPSNKKDDKKKKKLSVVKKPQKDVETPEPVIKEPEIVIETPEPVIKEPEIVIETPESVINEPDTVPITEVAPAQQDNIYCNMPKDKLQEIFNSFYEEMDTQYHQMKKNLRNYCKDAAEVNMARCNEEFQKLISMLDRLSELEEE